MISQPPITASLEIDPKKGTINSQIWILWMRSIVDALNALDKTTP